MKQISVVGAVLIRGSKILAAKRSPTMSLPGMWEFPGGKIEFGESPAEALRRELREELICDVEIGNRVETTSHQYEFGTVTLTTFYCTLLDGEPRLTEHEEIRWLSIDRLWDVAWAPADIPAVNRVERELAG